MREIVTLSADEIAEIQLLASIEVYGQKNYVAAITLAGAADEILGKRLRQIGKESAFGDIKRSVLSIMEVLPETEEDSEPVETGEADKALSFLINQTRNELKHYSGDQPLEFDIRADASEMIDRAIANFMTLHDVTLSEFIDYWAMASE